MIMSSIYTYRTWPKTAPLTDEELASLIPAAQGSNEAARDHLLMRCMRFILMECSKRHRQWHVKERYGDTVEDTVVLGIYGFHKTLRYCDKNTPTAWFHCLRLYIGNAYRREYEELKRKIPWYNITSIQDLQGRMNQSSRYGYCWNFFTEELIEHKHHDRTQARMDSKVARRALEECVTLTHAERTVLSLRYLRTPCMTYRELCKQIGKHSTESCRWIEQQGLRKLREYLA